MVNRLKFPLQFVTFIHMLSSVVDSVSRWVPHGVSHQISHHVARGRLSSLP